MDKWRDPMAEGQHLGNQPSHQTSPASNILFSELAALLGSVRKSWNVDARDVARAHCWIGVHSPPELSTTTSCLRFATRSW